MRISARFAMLWILVLCVAAILAPSFFSESANRMDFARVLEPPSWKYIFGTDALGRDLFHRILSGAGVSIGVAVVAVGLSLVVGVLVGAAAGFYGGWRDRALMMFVDMMLCFPVFFMILAIIAILGPNILNIMIVIGLTSWMGTARLVRAEVLSLKEREFILASRALGANDGWIIFKHLIPNALGPVIVNGILSISGAILMETGLSFLGIGVQPPTPSWGNILSDGKAVLGTAWWATLFPGLVIFLTVISANILGERLHEIIRGEK